MKRTGKDTNPLVSLGVQKTTRWPIGSTRVRLTISEYHDFHANLVLTYTSGSWPAVLIARAAFDNNNINKHGHFRNLSKSGVVNNKKA
jgi:hypothetical protein